MSSKEDFVLEMIVKLEGDCLNARLCRSCPFAATCLPDFIKETCNSPSKEHRLNMALDLITRKVLFEDDEVMEPER